jgi:3-mercaptopyruvate sulfurtransferase SseA
VRIVVHAAALTIAGLGVGLSANALSRRPVSLRHPVHAVAQTGACPSDPAGALPVVRISFEEAARLCAACTAAFVDARGLADFAAGHIAGAIHLPPAGHPEEAAALATLRAQTTVVVYDGDASCQLAEGIARRLQSLGCPDVRVLSGAWPVWVAAGGPGASGSCQFCSQGQGVAP